MNAIPSMSNAMQIAAGGIRKAISNHASDAHIVANSSAMSKETVAALIDARQQVLYTQAGAKMISASDEAVSSLLDVRA